MGLFWPQACYKRSWSGSVLVFSPGEIPTVDFYIRSRLSGAEGCRTEYIDVTKPGEALPEPEPGAFAIIVRHATADCLKYLARFPDRWSGIAFLMDDDIPAAWYCRDVPLDYGLWTSGRYALVASLLAKICDRVWVSTPELARRYARHAPLIVPPLADQTEYVVSAEDCRRWGYHGTRIHKCEIRWLAPLVEAVHAYLDDVEFEVFGNSDVAKCFAHIPRVHVLQPRPWREYVRYSRETRLAIGLAPLMSGYFNGARSHVKLFDLARSGATGIFSNASPYASLIAGAGISLLPNEQSRWAVEVVRLFGNASHRAWRFDETREWIEVQAREAKNYKLI